MANLNKVFLMGNLTRDPEKRVTPGGLTITKFGLAINRRFPGQDGEMREEVTFVDVDAFGKQADTIAQYCQKGRGLFVEGRLRLDTWQDKNTGENRSKMGVVLENFQFLDRAEGGAGRSASPDADSGYEQSSPPPRARKQASPAPKPSPSTQFEDDVPF